MKKNLLFGMVLLVSTLFAGELLAQAPVSVDPAVYTRRGANNEMALTNKWLYSNKLNNYNVAADFIGPTNYVRGMAVKNGKMLFINRDKKRIEVVNGLTGERETPITLASNLFTYMGRNKANTADSLWTAGTLTHNDIKIDNAGNVLLGNLITSNAGRFQVWKVNLTDGTGTLVIDQPDLATLYPAATTMRFDAFGVWGDVTKNAVILAANASATAMEVYKWIITNGVAAPPALIELDNSAATGADLAGLANLGTAPQVFPLDENYFYVDGNATFPVLCDKEGNVVDGFKATLPNSIKDSVTAPAATPKTIWSMNQGHNGLCEFEVAGKYFIVMAASNTAATPPSTFRLFQFKDANKAFSGLTCLWTFPQAGMGAASNAYRTAMPCVEVNGTKANIYVYTGENGYGMYEFDTAAPALGVLPLNESYVIISVENNRIQLSEEVASLELYSVSGQKIASAKNISFVAAPSTKGIYIVNITDQEGNRKIQKVAVN
jgi:hypothetical protein